MPNPADDSEFGDAMVAADEDNAATPADGSPPTPADASAELGASGSGGGGGGKSRVKGPWSPEEDAILTQLVSKFGARNWSLIARGIPGRSGKSCRLRWCNQLDPGVKRKPFTGEEDRIIISAHAIHGNKWAAIARLLPGRTDNAIKNHWNSTLRRRCTDQGRFNQGPIDDDSPEKTKASSEETLSANDITMDESQSHQQDKAQAENLPQTNIIRSSAPLARPKPRVSAFSVYNSPGSPQICSGVATQGRFVQGVTSGFESCKFLQDIDPTVPLQCGYGCCRMPSDGSPCSSLLGPEFVEYEEIPPFSSQELVAIATDLNNIAWIKSGLEQNSSNGASSVAFAM